MSKGCAKYSLGESIDLFVRPCEKHDARRRFAVPTEILRGIRVAQMK
jgi:hypothetical protein